MQDQEDPWAWTKQSSAATIGAPLGPQIQSSQEQAPASQGGRPDPLDQQLQNVAFGKGMQAAEKGVEVGYKAATAAPLAPTIQPAVIMPGAEGYATTLGSTVPEVVGGSVIPGAAASAGGFAAPAALTSTAAPLAVEAGTAAAVAPVAVEGALAAGTGAAATGAAGAAAGSAAAGGMGAALASNPVGWAILAGLAAHKLGLFK